MKRSNDRRGSRLIFTLLGLLLAVAGLVVGVDSQASATMPHEFTSIVTQPATDDVAIEILGRPAPMPQAVPAGFTRTQLMADPPTRPIGPRFVHQSFGLHGANIARLDAYRGIIARVDGEVLRIGGRDVTVNQKQLADGSANVTYVWMQDGLALTLNINISRGLNRADADALVASIR